MISGARRPYSLIVRVVGALPTHCAKAQDELSVGLRDQKRSDHVQSQLAEPNTTPQAQVDHPNGKDGESAEGEPDGARHEIQVHHEEDLNSITAEWTLCLFRHRRARFPASDLMRSVRSVFIV